MLEKRNDRTLIICLTVYEHYQSKLSLSEYSIPMCGQIKGFDRSLNQLCG